MINVINVNPDLIVPSPINPRRFAPNGSDLIELAESIKAQGLISPIVIRILATPNRFEIVAGERRFRAWKLARPTEFIPALVRTLTDKEAYAITITENLQRKDISAIEESNGVKSLLDAGWTARDVAKELGKAEGWINRRARIAQMHPKMIALINKEFEASWPANFLEAIAVLDPAVQLEIATHAPYIISNTRDLKGLKYQLSRYHHDLRNAPWDVSDEAFVPKAGSCTNCTKRSSCTVGLFDSEDDALPPPPTDQCLDAICWKAKATKYLAVNMAKLIEAHPKLQKASVSSDRLKDKGVISFHYLHDKESTCYPAGREIEVIWIDGPNIGTIRKMWINADKKAAKAAKPAPDAKKKGPPTKKDRDARERKLELRRQAYLIEQIRDSIEEEKRPTHDHFTAILALAAHLGLDRGHDYNKPATFIKQLKDDANDADLLRATIWDRLCRNLRDTINVKKLDRVDATVPLALHYASLLGLDIAAFQKKACAEIPRPKSWDKK